MQKLKISIPMFCVGILILAEAKGFEPLCPLRQTVFKTASL